MTPPSPSDTQTDLSRVLKKITEIADASDKGDYIYRGEPECYEKISSSLYRIPPDPEGIQFDISMEDFQNAILREARAYISKTDDIDETDDIGILTQLQHFGGKTNLIDFTEDYLIALFFACDGSHEKEGRVILLKRKSADYDIREPRRVVRRVESQKSVFIESPTGFVEPNIVVIISAELKQPMLNYLRKNHRISIETIYNDLHGFIRRSPYVEFLKGLASQRDVDKAKTRIETIYNGLRGFIRWSPYVEFLKGLTSQRDVDKAKVGDEKHRYSDNAVRHYTEALKLDPDFVKAYINRAIAYRHKGDFDAAIQDCTKAIELKPDSAEAYTNRGNAYADKNEVNKAIQDYNKAIELKPDHAHAYNNRGTAYRRIGKVNKAIQDHSKAIELKPDYVIAYDSRGVDYYYKGDFDAAIQDCTKAIELKPDYPYAYDNRGCAYLRKGEFDRAIQDYNRALDLNPEYVQTYSHRGEAWLHLSEWEKAKMDLSTAKNKGIDLTTSFCNPYESVEDFEAKYGVKIPENIAVLLQRTNPSSRRAKYKSYTQLLIDELREKHNFTRARAGQPDNWYEFSAGIRGIRYSVQFKRGDKVTTSIKIYENVQSNRFDLFDALKERKEEIESAFGSPLEWERLEGQQRSRIVVSRDGNIELPDAELEHIRAWHIANLLKLKAVFQPEIKNALETLT